MSSSYDDSGDLHAMEQAQAAAQASADAPPSFGDQVVSILSAPFTAAKAVGEQIGGLASDVAHTAHADAQAVAAGLEDTAQHGQDALAGALPDAVGRAAEGLTGPAIGVAIGVPIGLGLLYIIFKKV